MWAEGKYPKEGSLLKGRRPYRKYAEQFNEVLNSYNFFLYVFFFFPPFFGTKLSPVSVSTTLTAPVTIPGQRPKTELPLGTRGTSLQNQQRNDSGEGRIVIRK